MFALFTSECAVAIAAEFMKRRFRRLRQIRACAAMAVVAAAEAGLVDEVVMAGDAIDGSMILMRKKCVQRRGRRCGLQQVQTADGGRQEQQRGERNRRTGISVENNRSRIRFDRGRQADQNSASASRTQQVAALRGRSSSWPLPTMCAASRPSSSAASTACAATLADDLRRRRGIAAAPTGRKCRSPRAPPAQPAPRDRTACTAAPTATDSVPSMAARPAESRYAERPETTRSSRFGGAAIR